MIDKRKVIILGDSFTFGHSCSDRIFYYDHDLKTFIGDEKPFMENIPSKYCWPALLQEKYDNIEVVNLSKPANCNQGMFRNLIEYNSKNDVNEGDILMYHGTFPTRIEIAAGSRPEVATPWVMGWDHQSQMENEIEYNVAKKLYLTHLFNDTIGSNLSLTALLSSYAFAITHNLKFVWSLPLYVYDNYVLNALRPINKFRLTHICKYDFSGKDNYEFNKDCFAPDHHVNDKGHAIYLEKEIIPAMQTLL